MKQARYITTTLPYVNAKPHVGFASEIIRADVLARFWRLQGHEVFFNTGTDEHGQKIYQKAQELGIDPQVYCDQMAENFKSIRPLLNLSYDNFIRTTDTHHIEAAQEFWKRCDENGYITKKKYKIKYCVGCELEKTESELDHGKCPLHPNHELEIIEEENYFFKFSQFSQKLSDFYKKNPDFVAPEQRFREIKAFVEQGLEDFSISRLKSKMPWGVPVPGDDQQVMYVWFDALVNYISALGWPTSVATDVASQSMFDKFWPGYQICGKDNLRQQTAMWQAMLMAAGLPTSEKIYINGFINVGGQKMSKSLGNVISPEEMVQRYGVDATRYLLLTMGVFGEDMDITWGKMDEKYNADLANGIGNLASRVITLYAKTELVESIDELFSQGERKFVFANDNEMKAMNFSSVLNSVFVLTKLLDKLLEKEEPWKLIKADKEAFDMKMKVYIQQLNDITACLTPFMPETTEKIKRALQTKEVQPLFKRI